MNLTYSHGYSWSTADYSFMDVRPQICVRLPKYDYVPKEFLRSTKSVHLLSMFLNRRDIHRPTFLDEINVTFILFSLTDDREKERLLDSDSNSNSDNDEGRPGDSDYGSSEDERGRSRETDSKASFN